MKTCFATLASAAVLAAATFNISFAQTSDNAPSDQPPPAQAPVAQSSGAGSDHKGPLDNQIADDADARIARLKADLRLTPDQENNWAGLRGSLRDYEISQVTSVMAGRSAHEDRRDDRPNDIAIMRTEADRLTASGAALKKLAEAADPLYGTLDDRQRHKLVQYIKSDFEMQHK